MAVITISRQFGAGGLTLGKIVAEGLGYTFVSDEIIEMVACKAKVSSDWVKMVEEGAGGRLQRLISSMIPKNLVDRILSDERGWIDEEIYMGLLGQIVVQIAEEGNCVILGRGGQYILKDRSDTLHVLLIAAKEDRVDFMSARYKLPREQAVQAVTLGDKRRTHLFHKFDKVDYDRPEHYHLTLNMSRLAMERAAVVIQSAARGL